MISLSKMAQMTDLQAAEHIATAAIESAALDSQDLATVVNDVWIESAGNLHRFASKVRDGDDFASGLLEDVLVQRCSDIHLLLTNLNNRKA